MFALLVVKVVVRNSDCIARVDVPMKLTTDQASVQSDSSTPGMTPAMGAGEQIGYGPSKN